MLQSFVQFLFGGCAGTKGTPLALDDVQIVQDGCPSFRERDDHFLDDARLVQFSMHADDHTRTSALLVSSKCSGSALQAPSSLFSNPSRRVATPCVAAAVISYLRSEDRCKC